MGRSGRQVVKDYLPEVIEKYKPDFIIANGENMLEDLVLQKKYVKICIPMELM